MERYMTAALNLIILIIYCSGKSVLHQSISHLIPVIASDFALGRREIG